MKKDLVDYTYLSDNGRYADLLNGTLFGGKQVIESGSLKEMDSKVVSGRRKLRTRDLIRKCGKDTSYAVFGVENQEEVSYCMPFRMLEYEAEEYARQMERIRRKNKEAKDLTSGEFLEKFRKKDRLMPCVSLVLYWGKDWDGAVSLREMMDLVELPEGLEKYVNDYPIHLVKIREIKDSSVFKTDLRQVVDFLKCAENKEKMKALVEDNPDYRHLDMETYDVMMAHAHSKELEGMREYTEKENGDMCKALQDWAAEEREIGMQEGIEKGLVQGMEQGIEKGLADGILRAKREAILNMLELGVSKESILTKYTAEEYEQAVASDAAVFN